MAQIAIYNLEGKITGDINISDAVFAVKPNAELLRQVYMVMAGNQRSPIAHTKGKGEVAGSGKKPFKQKGTGSARQGQKRNPIMKGGGVSFGPTKDRNFKRDLNKKMKQKAVVIALSDKLRSGTLIAVEDLIVEKPKTAVFAKILKSLEIKGSVLLSYSNDEKKMSLYSRNLVKVDNIETKDISVFDLLNHKYVLLSKKSIAYLEEKFAK